MYKIAIAVHRFWPHPGGSENNCIRLATALVELGHDVTVVCDQGESYKGVKVSHTYEVLREGFDLIVVHGSAYVQDVILKNIDDFQDFSGPVYYMIVQPSKADFCIEAVKKAAVVGCGSNIDFAYANSIVNNPKKLKKYNYPIDKILAKMPGEFRQKFGITTKYMYLSTGGFWPHKNFNDLAVNFFAADVPDTTLVLTGYDKGHQLPTHDNVKVKVLTDLTNEDIENAFLDADLYILNSLPNTEGYGLGIIEAMAQGCEWISTPTPAALDMQSHGIIYRSSEQLQELLKNFPTKYSSVSRTEKFPKVIQEHLPSYTAQQIVNVIDELKMGKL